MEELNKEIADKNMTEEQMKTKIVAQEELVDKLSQVITRATRPYISLFFKIVWNFLKSDFNTVRGIYSE